MGKHILDVVINLFPFELTDHHDLDKEEDLGGGEGRRGNGDYSDNNVPIHMFYVLNIVYSYIHVYIPI